MCEEEPRKDNFMVADNTPINVNNVLIENVDGYVYLGQHYSLKENNQDKEICRSIMAGCAADAKHPDIFISNIADCLTIQVFNSCVLPAMAYAHTKMVRSMLNITYRDRKTNIWVRERTQVMDVT